MKPVFCSQEFATGLICGIFIRKQRCILRVSALNAISRLTSGRYLLSIGENNWRRLYERDRLVRSHASRKAVCIMMLDQRGMRCALGLFREQCHDSPYTELISQESVRASACTQALYMAASFRCFCLAPKRASRGVLALAGLPCRRRRLLDVRRPLCGGDCWAS